MYTSDFNEFWDHYPRKIGKLGAFKKYSTMKKQKILPDIEVLIKAISDQKNERTFLKSQNRFCPEWKHPSTWLNNGCWEDECEIKLQVSRTPEKRNGSGLANMQRAYNILRNLGESKFNEFCQGVRMPESDKEAVLNRYKGVFPDVKQLVAGIG